MRGMQNFGSGLKRQAQVRTWLAHFCRIRANSLENVPALVYTSNDQTETNSKGSNLIRPGAQPSNYVWHCRHLPN